MVFTLPADDVYEKDLLKSGFPQQSSVTSSSEPAGARPPHLQKKTMSLLSKVLSHLSHVKCSICSNSDAFPVQDLKEDLPVAIN